jgi:cytochrome c-type biogenesis protein CcmF
VTALGEPALWIALPIALWGGVVAFLGARWGRGELVLSAERSVHAVLLLLLVATAAVVGAFLGDRFEYVYVHEHSSLALHPLYKVSGLWAGARGSLLFWALGLAGFASLAAWLDRRRNRDLVPYAVGVLLGVLAFALILLLALAPPFERTAFAPLEGRGLDARLQSPWMVVHPPALHLGLAALAVPFAFGVSALLAGRLDVRWLRLARRWTLAGWILLTVGIVLGMLWAYEAPASGGYWSWDPVENAWLLPWLTGAAFLHSARFQDRRGMLKAWNVGLVAATFLLALFATFLPWSGLVLSERSFTSSPAIARAFLTLMAVAGGAAAWLVSRRLPELRSERGPASASSREGVFLFTHLVLLGIAFVVLWGTLFPLLSEALTGSRVAVGPVYFERMVVPLGLLLLALLGVGPAMAWGRSGVRKLGRNLLPSLGAGLALGGGLFVLGARHPYALPTFGLAAFVLTSIAVELRKETRAHARAEGERPRAAFTGLLREDRARWGGALVHVGIVVMLVGLAGSAFDVEVQGSLDAGESVSVRSPFGGTYTLTYEGLSTQQGRNTWEWTALLSVRRAGAIRRPVTTGIREYVTPRQSRTEPGIRRAALEDLYVVLVALEDPVPIGAQPDSERASFRIFVKPLVSWVWVGGLVASLGALATLRPTAALPPARKGGPRRGRRPSGAATSPAGVS